MYPLLIAFYCNRHCSRWAEPGHWGQASCSPKCHSSPRCKHDTQSNLFNVCGIECVDRVSVKTKILTRRLINDISYFHENASKCEDYYFTWRDVLVRRFTLWPTLRLQVQRASQCTCAGEIWVAAIVSQHGGSRKSSQMCEIRFVWSCPTWPNRWGTHISKEWPRLKSCHAACGEKSALASPAMRAVYCQGADGGCAPLNFGFKSWSRIRAIFFRYQGFPFNTIGDFLDPNIRVIRGPDCIMNKNSLRN